MIEAFAGFTAGAAHVLAGPDHLAAVAPLASVRRGVRAWTAGARWGLGHALGVAVVGGLAIALGGFLPAGFLDSLSGWSERFVGVVLIGIGLWGLRRLYATRVHAHAHEHDGEPHVHVHVHGPAVPHETPAAHVHTHAAFAVGALHGVAGSSHVFGVLPALALPPVSAALWLAGFGAGTIAGMGGFAAGLGALAGHRAGSWHRALAGSCAGLALLVGGFWLLG